jgi:aminopeptidase N
MKFFTLSIYLLAISLNTYTQNINTSDDIKMIAESEKRKYIKKPEVLTNLEETNYDVFHQRLNLELNPGTNYIKGTIATKFRVLENSVQSISFDMEKPLVVDSIIYNKEKITYTHQDSKLNVLLPKVLNMGDIDSVSVYYQGVPKITGFEAFTNSNHSSGKIIWTLSEPMGAKTWWPCKQSLNDKIDSVDIIVSAPIGYTTAANGLLISEKLENGRNICHWKHRHPIAAYLVAVAVTNYSHYTDWITFNDGKTMPIENYVYPYYLSYAQSISKEIIPIFKFYYDKFIPYPFVDEKYGHAQFGWGGGMEHQTISFMHNLNRNLMAHELAHQWFGDYITCRSWKDIWLNEGFATYLTALADENLLGKKALQDWLISARNTVTQLPDGSVYVYDTTNVDRIFSSRLSYQKGAYVLHMLRCEMGDDYFFQAIKNYLKDPRLANGYASTIDLRKHGEKVIGYSLEKFFQQWIYGEGYPIYSITWNQQADGVVNVKIDQTTSHSSVNFYEMHVPIRFLGSSKDTLVIFENKINGENFRFKTSEKLSAASFDPDNNLLAKSTVTLGSSLPHNEMVIDIYPNPANGMLTVNFDKHYHVKNIWIYTLSGNKVIDAVQQKGIQQKITLDISALQNGMYFLKIETTKGWIIRKFVKNTH